MKASNYLPKVREHYETLPYPPRDPENEKHGLLSSYTCELDRINYYHYAGKRDFSKGFRALVAGGGTGDSLIMLAEQLRDFGGEVVYLDISKASMAIAQSRATIRKLTNITWVHGSILDAPQCLEGTFDYINCIGVLHHLESPEAGLKALAAKLKPDGVMGLMLYARHGRNAIYQIQELLRIINKNEEDIQRRIDHCKAVLRNLPKHHPIAAIQDLVLDIDSYGDSGIYDLFLHSNDVAYSVPEVYAFLRTSGLVPTHFLFDQHSDKGNDLYSIDSYFDALPAHLAQATQEEKQAAAELMHGRILKHVFYATRHTPKLPSLDNTDNIPFLSMIFNENTYQDILALLRRTPVGQSITLQMEYMQLVLEKTPYCEAVFQHIDGKNSIAQILSAAIKASKPNAPSRAELEQELARLYRLFNRLDWMFLRDPSAPAVKSAPAIQRAMG